MSCPLFLHHAGSVRQPLRARGRKLIKSINQSITDAYISTNQPINIFVADAHAASSRYPHIYTHTYAWPSAPDLSSPFPHFRLTASMSRTVYACMHAALYMYSCAPPVPCHGYTSIRDCVECAVIRATTHARRRSTRVCSKRLLEFEPSTALCVLYNW